MEIAMGMATFWSPCGPGSPQGPLAQSRQDWHPRKLQVPWRRVAMVRTSTPATSSGHRSTMEGGVPI